jgi:hypothetical protein
VSIQQGTLDFTRFLLALLGNEIVARRVSRSQIALTTRKPIAAVSRQYTHLTTDDKRAAMQRLPDVTNG